MKDVMNMKNGYYDLVNDQVTIKYEFYIKK